MRVLGLLIVLVPTTVIAAFPALAETGSLGNTLDIPVTYQAGVPDANGMVAWQSYTIAPCETHQWSWDQGGQPNIHFIWPTWRDQRKDEYGNMLMQRNVIPMTDQGTLTTFFPYGDQIWIDSSGNAKMDTCAAAAAAPAPAPSPGPVVTPPPAGQAAAVSPPPAASSEGSPSGAASGFGAGLSSVELNALLDRVDRGEVILLDINKIDDIAFMVGARIIPIAVEDFALLLYLAAASAPDEASAIRVIQAFLTTAVMHSDALSQTLRTQSNALSAKN